MRRVGGRKGIRLENLLARLFMMWMDYEERDQARAYSRDDAQPDRREVVRRGLRLPYQERIRIKKIAQRRRRRQALDEEKTIQIGTLNVGTMTGKAMETVDLMTRRRLNILCVQETRWKGKKARELGNGYKLFYCGAHTKRNGVGIVLNEDLKKNVLAVNRESDRIIWMKIEISKQITNIVSVYAPQAGCDEEEKEEFWNHMYDLLIKVPVEEPLWIAGDLNGHVGEGNTGAEENMGKFGIGNKNEAGDKICNFARAGGLVIINTLFCKRKSQRITYTSGGNNTQVDYILCRGSMRKHLMDCKVIPGESVAKQHKPLVCRTKIKPQRPAKYCGTKKTRWWKLQERELKDKFVQQLQEKLRNDKTSWEDISLEIQRVAKQILGETTGKRKERKETWWWNNEVQTCIQIKKEKKKARDQEWTNQAIDEYKRANKAAQRAVATAKAEAYKELYESLDTPEGYEKAIRIAKNKNTNSADILHAKLIKDKDGRTLVDEEQIRLRWKVYFEQLMNIENDREVRTVEPNTDIGLQAISADEIKKALKKMKNGKSVGPDDIPAEVWKCLGDTGVEILKKTFNDILQNVKMPDEWRSSTLVPIYKNKGDVQDCGNYRGIKLMSHTMKIWERVIDTRLRNIVNISEQQFGFIPGRSTTDAVFALRQLGEKYREGQRNLHCVFIDLEKAFDRVPREELWNCLREKKVPENYVRIVQDMYNDSSTAVRCVNSLSESFAVSVGVHQGSALSPLLFAIVMDCLTKDIHHETPWDMMFADDIVLCTETKEEAERRLEEWRNALERRGMKVSRKKTEYLCMQQEEVQGSLKIQDNIIPRKSEFKYLGSTVQADGGAEKEVVRRVQAGWNNWKKITGIMCDRKVPEKLKGKMYKTIVRPAMLYGLETVPLTKSQEKKIETEEMRILRFSLGLTRLDRVKNEVVRQRMGVTNLSAKLRETRLRWYGHVYRKDENYVGKRVQRLVVGKRKRGRPKRRWLDCIKIDMATVGVRKGDALNRDAWRRAIRTGDPT